MHYNIGQLQSELGLTKRLFSVIGQGVWGIVIDLLDGSVLKLARQVAGIGDGIEKVEREIICKT